MFTLINSSSVFLAQFTGSFTVRVLDHFRRLTCWVQNATKMQSEHVLPEVVRCTNQQQVPIEFGHQVVPSLLADAALHALIQGVFIPLKKVAQCSLYFRAGV